MAAYLTGILSDQEMSEVLIRVNDMKHMIARVLQLRSFWTIIDKFLDLEKDMYIKPTAAGWLGIAKPETHDLKLDTGIKIKLGTLFKILENEDFKNQAPKY